MRIEMVKSVLYGRRRWAVQVVDGLTTRVLGVDLDYLQALELAITWRVRNRVFGVPLRAVVPNNLRSPARRR